MLRQLSLPLSLLLFGLACQHDDPSDDDACAIGDSERCVCGNDEPGSRVCLPDATFGDCRCLDPATTDCGTPGTELGCLCSGGERGSQVCLASGEASRCRCPEQHPEPAAEAETQPEPDADTAPDLEADSDPDKDATPDPAKDPAPNPDPTPAPQRCCHGLGTCLSRTVVPPSQSEGFAAESCQPSDALLCVPEAFANPAGFSLQPCRSIAQAEGRCAPDCLPGMDDLQGVMPQDLCPSHHLCVACFDPFSGASTGICNLSNDNGPRERGVVFGNCCDDRGACVPGQLVPEAQQSLLAGDTCDPELDLLCVPTPLAEPDGFTLTTCRALDTFEGRCAPTCLPSVVQPAATLDRESCTPNELCVPCFDPLSGDPTGICELSNDPGPAEPAAVLPSCCDQGAGPLGVCLPASLLPPEAQTALPQETCPTATLHCTPVALASDPTAGFPACNEADGGCVPECLLDAAALDALSQQECSAGEKCVPCMLFGEPTGVCQP